MNSLSSKDLEDRKDDAAIIATGSVDEIGAKAKIAIEHEHELTFLQAMRLYPKAAGWSIFFSLGIIMTAFDPQLLGNLYATPAFQRDFGYLYQGSYIISAPWQTGLSMGSPIGQVVGALFAGYPMEWFGRKLTFCCLRHRHDWLCLHPIPREVTTGPIGW
jgi:hypothetical protein